MKLEDHVGDILAKARAMAGVSAPALAQAAGLSEADLLALEESGQIPKPLNYQALAGLLGVDGPKLQALAEGWLPEPVDLSQWRELRCLSSSCGGMAVNAYLVWDEVSREAALFDTGWEAAPIVELVRANELQLRHLFITHSHQDHVAALEPLRQAFPKMRLHTSVPGAPVEQRNRPNDFIHLGSLRITHRATPGHAEEGTSYIVGTWPEDAPHVVMVGDAIFAGSMGKGNQSWSLARQAVREQLLSLPPASLLCPGHGPLSTVAQEKAHNPFF